MAPPVATETSTYDATPSSVLLQKSEIQMNGGSQKNGALDQEVDENDENLENWEGKYRFAPIQEAQVSRAMIKRYVAYFFETMWWPMADMGMVQIFQPDV